MVDVDAACDLEAALDAALLAGAAVMLPFRRDEPVRYKSAEQPVTAADLLADRVIRERLLSGRPDYAWLSEESLDDPDRLGRSRVWIVDPIDGTNSFVAGLPEFVVSIALIENGEPVVGVIHNPATGEMYHATRGGGAYRDGVPIRALGPSSGARPILLSSRVEMAEGVFEGMRGDWTCAPSGAPRTGWSRSPTAPARAPSPVGPSTTGISAPPRSSWWRPGDG